MIVNTILVLIEYEQFRKYNMIVLKDAPDITIEMPKELLSGTICLHIYGLQAKDIDLQTYGCEELSGYTKAEFKGRYFLYMHYIIQVVENKHLFENYLRTNSWKP